jgi:hypothetical protein
MPWCGRVIRDPVVRVIDERGTIMSTSFVAWNAFQRFSRVVRSSSRFFHRDLIRSFLEALAESAEKRRSIIPAEKVIWRAQLGHGWQQRSQDGVTWDEPVPFRAERMMPTRHGAAEGRANPRGTPCVYAANDRETAVAEVRPWVDALVSVALLRVVRELHLVDCSDAHDMNFDIYLEEPSPEEREAVIWREIGRAFSSPVNPYPEPAEYAPTQMIAEHFRKLHYDGIIYKSKLGPGYNLALFDLDAVEVVDIQLYPLKDVRYEVGQVQDSYVVRHGAAGT